MSKQHISPDESQEFYTDERCHILELLHNQSDEALSIARARVEPEVTTAWHYLINTTEYYYILQGKGRMELRGENPVAVKSGDIITIPPETSQRITNLSSTEDLVFLAICTPAFRDEVYHQED